MKKFLAVGTILFSLIIIFPLVSSAEEIRPTGIEQPKPAREGDFKTLKEYEAFKAAQGTVRQLGIPEVKKEIKSDIKDIRTATNPQDKKTAVQNLKGDVAGLGGDKQEIMRGMEVRMKLGAKERMERIEGEKKEFAERINTSKEEFSQRIEERKAILKEKLTAKFGDRAQEKSENISQSIENAVANFTKHIEKLNDVSSKIETELNSLSTAGKDITVLSAALVDAKVNIAAAETVLTEFQTSYEAMTSASDPKSAFLAVKDTGKKVAEAIRAAHKGLMDLIPQIRSLKGEAEGTAAQVTEGQNTNQ